MKIVEYNTIEVIVISQNKIKNKSSGLFVLIIYTWVNSAQPKKKYKELETFNMALQRTSTHFQRFKSFMFNNTSNLGFSFFLRHMWFFHYLLTYCQDYSNCFELQQWIQKGKRGRIEKDFFLSTFKEASEPREPALELGESKTALGWEGVGTEREWRPFLCMVFLSLK